MLEKIKYNKRKIMFICFMVLLIAQVVRIIHFGNVKMGFHEDEMFTYTLANYPDGFVKDTEGIFENWTSGEVYYSTLSVSDEERFNYGMVYENQEKDVHPPLYYYVIHTVSSMFPGCFSKWIGIFPNLVFSILISCVFYSINKKIFKNDVLALVCTGIWAFSTGAMNATIYIRMYTMLTFFVVILIRLHLKCMEEIENLGEISGITGICLFLCTCLGILTQYYYMVFCFFLCGIFCLYLLTKKNWKELLKYSAVEIGAVLGALIYYPAMIKHIFSDYRGKQAFDSLSNVQGFIEDIKKLMEIISQQLFGGWLEIIFKISIILVITILVLRFLKQYLCFKIQFQANCSNMEKNRSTSKIVIALGVVALGYLTIILKIAPYIIDRYFVCVYPIVTMVVMYTVNQLLLKLAGKYSIILVTISFLILTLLSIDNQYLDYLYGHYAKRTESLDVYQGVPAIVLNGDYDSAADKWLWEYGNYEMVYRCTSNGKYQGLQNAVNTGNLSNGFLLYAHGIHDSDEEVLKMVEEYIDLASFEKVTDKGCRVFWCTLKK